MRPGRHLFAISALVFAAGPALAADPPPKKLDAKAQKKSDKKGDKKPPKEEPPPEPEPPKAPPPEPPPDDTPPPPPPAQGDHSETRFGVGLLLGVPLVKADSGSFGPRLFPEIGLQFVVDIPLSKPLFLRIEPTFSTLSRSGVKQVAVSVDNTKTPPVEELENITNTTRTYEFVPRVALGYDITPMFSTRLGVGLGVSFARTTAIVNQQNSEDCQSIPARSSLVPWLGLNPLTVRIPIDKNVGEVGLWVSYSWRTFARCDRPLPDGQLVVKGNERIDVTAKVLSADLSALVFGLQGTLLAW